MKKEQYSEKFNHIYTTLNSEEKRHFLIALLTKNNNELKNILGPISKKTNSDIKSFEAETANYFKESKKGEAVPFQILECIKVSFSTEKKQELLLLLLNVFQSIPEASFDNQNSMSMKTKKGLLPIFLEKVDTNIKSTIIAELTDLSYTPILPALSPSEVKIKSRITINEYKAAGKCNLDLSEFLILTIALLKDCEKVLPPSIGIDLACNYLFTNYDDCLKSIKDYCEERLNQYVSSVFKLSPTETEIFKIVLTGSKNISKFDFEKNSAREFFETRLSQYIVGLGEESKSKSKSKENGNLNHATLTAVNKILQYFLGEAGKVHNSEELEVKISIFANSYKDKKRFDPHRLEEIQKHNEEYQKRDRIAKSPYIERKHEATESDVSEHQVFSSSGGVMKGKTPTFLNSQLPPIRNALNCVTVKAPYDSKKAQWGHERIYSAYVGSISGHAANIIGMLEYYLKDPQNSQNKDKTVLSNDINMFLVQIVGVYAKRGYHSMLEVMDIIHSKSIQNLFKQYHVNVNLHQCFLNENLHGQLLNYAMDDALAYTKTLVFKRGVHNDLLTSRALAQ